MIDVTGGSTFKAYKQDRWPMQDLKVATENPEGNTVALNYLSSKTRVLNEGKTLVVAKNELPGFVDQGDKDIMRCGSSLAGLTFIAANGQESQCKGTYDQFAPGTAPAGLDNVASIAEWAKDPFKADKAIPENADANVAEKEVEANTFLSDIFRALPGVRSQGMYSFEQYLMGNGLEENLVFNMTGLSAVSDFGFHFDDYCTVEYDAQATESKTALINNIGIAYGEDGSVLAVLYRQITVAEIGNDYHYSVEHHYILPEKLHASLASYTPLEAEQGLPPKIMEQLRKILDNGDYKHMQYAKKSNAQDEVMASLDTQIDQRALRLKEAIGIVASPENAPAIQEPLYLHGAIPAMAACAAAGLLGESMLDHIAEMGKTFERWPGIIVSLRGAVEYGTFVGEENSPKLREVRLNMEQMIEQVVQGIFTDDARGQQLRESLENYPQFCEVFLGLSFVDLFCNEKKFQHAEFIQAVYERIESPKENGVTYVTKFVINKMDEIDAQSLTELAGPLGYDGEGSKGKYLKPISAELRDLAGKMKSVEACQGLVKQIEGYDKARVFGRKFHNAGVWLGKAADSFMQVAFGRGQSSRQVAAAEGVAPAEEGAQVRASNSYTLMQRVGISSKPIEQMSARELKKQVERCVKDWIPDTGKQAKGYDFDRVEQLITAIQATCSNDAGNGISDQHYYGQRLIGAGLRYFLVGEGKDSSNQRAEVVKLIGQLSKIGRNDLSSAKGVMLSSRRYIRALFDSRSKVGISIDSQNHSDIAMAPYTDAKEALFDIMLEDDLAKIEGHAEKTTLMAELRSAYQHAQSTDRILPEGNSSFTGGNPRMHVMPGIDKSIDKYSKEIDNAGGSDSGYGGPDNEDVVAASPQ